ncbi:MAG: response regulator [Proteobacteria bacterium]|nr:response regulator [Pseudomonadota bacterium]MBI3496260.1 response regulator [Pseudomonadota bacterium]
MRILVAEDDRSSRLLLTAMLDGLGCQVDLAENGREAVEAVRLMRYDLVMMDLHMPGLGGAEAASAIRALSGRRAAIPIVVLTGDPFEDTVERCLAAGVNEVIAKPIAEAKLQAVIAKWTKAGLARVGSSRQDDQPRSHGRELAARLGATVFQEIAAHFLEDAPRYLAELERAAASAAMDDVAFHAHRLAGAAKTFGLGELAERGRTILDACHDRADAKARDLVAGTRGILDHALAQLSEECRDIQAPAVGARGKGGSPQ